MSRCPRRAARSDRGRSTPPNGAATSPGLRASGGHGGLDGAEVTDPSWRPRRLKPGPSPPPGPPLRPRTPTLLFCKSPEIFMALRRAPLNEFLIKTPSGSQNTPPTPPKSAPSGVGGVSGPAGTGRMEEPGPVRALFTGGSPWATRGAHGHRGRGSHPNAGHGNSESGRKIWGARRPGPASCSSRGCQGAAEPPGSPGWTGRALGGRGRAFRCRAARPREIFVNEEMHKRSSLGQRAEPEAFPAAPGRELLVPGAGRAGGAPGNHRQRHRRGPGSAAANPDGSGSCSRARPRSGTRGPQGVWCPWVSPPPQGRIWGANPPRGAARIPPGFFFSVPKIPGAAGEAGEAENPFPGRFPGARRCQPAEQRGIWGGMK